MTRFIRISKKKFLAIMLLFSPSLAWFYVFRDCLFRVQDKLTSQGINLSLPSDGFFLFYLSIAVFAIIGSLISEKVNRKKLLGSWILFGLLANISLVFSQDLISLIVSSVVAGASFGFGFPSCLAFLADSTNIEERGRISGVVVLITYLIAIIFFGLGFVFQLSLTILLILSLCLRTMSFIALVLDPYVRIQGNKTTWSAIFKAEGFIFYFASWLLFLIADGIAGLFEGWLPESIKSIADFGGLVSYLGIVFSSLISGFTSDRFGRKKTIMFGLAMLGISYAFFAIITSMTTYIITMFIYGSAVGIIIVTYFITVIGDIATEGSKERFYSLGAVMPFILFLIVDLFSGVLETSLSASMFSTILSMLLFISIIPLIYAPETLSIKIIEKRKMKEHVERVAKQVQESNKS